VLPALQQRFRADEKFFSLGVCGFDLESAPIAGGSPFQLPPGTVGVAQQIVRGDVTRIVAHGAGQSFNSQIRLGCFQIAHTELTPSLGVLKVFHHHFAQHCNCRREVSAV